jgi:hypothetical protein
LKLGMVIPPALLFLLSIVLVIRSLLYIQRLQKVERAPMLMDW